MEFYNLLFYKIVETLLAMPSKRKRPLTESEKLLNRNCSGGQYRSSSHDIKTHKSDVSITTVDSDGESIINSAGENDDILSEDQDDSNFSLDGLSNKVEDIMIAEVIEQMKNKPSSVEIIHDDADLHEFFMYQENRQSQVHDFGDTPQILVGDNNSVCYPVVEETVRPTEPCPLVEQDKKKDEMIGEQNTRQDTSNEIKGNALLPMKELENRIMMNLVCVSCIKDQLKCKKFASDIKIDDARVTATTSNVAFASSLVIECRHGRHVFTVESPRVSKIPSSEMNVVSQDNENTVLEN